LKQKLEDKHLSVII